MVHFGRPRAATRLRWPSSAPPPPWPSPKSRSITSSPPCASACVERQADRQPDLRRDPRIHAQYRGRRHRRRHRHGGSRRAAASPRRRSWKPSSSATNAARRSAAGIRETGGQDRQDEVGLTRPLPSTRNCTTQIETAVPRRTDRRAEHREVRQARKLPKIDEAQAKAVALAARREAPPKPASCSISSRSGSSATRC